MKSQKLFSFISLVLLLTFTSCKLEKRLYISGSEVEFVKMKSVYEKHLKVSREKPIETVFIQTLEPRIVDNPNDEFIVASTGNPNAILKSYPIRFFKKIEFKTPFVIEKCDTITFKNHYQMIVHIKEVTDDEIKWKKCDSTSKSVFRSKKSEVYKINYANGTEIIVSPDYTAVYEKEKVDKKKPEDTSLIQIGLWAMLGGLVVFGISILIAEQIESNLFPVLFIIPSGLAIIGGLILMLVGWLTNE